MSAPVGREDRSSVERVRSALGANISQDHGDQLYARCPAHDDTKPSLSATYRVSPDKGGRVLLRCHSAAGCDTPTILDALGLTWADLFDEPPARPATDKQRWTPPARKPATKRTASKPATPTVDPTTLPPRERVASHPYADADGRVAYEVVRWSRAAIQGERGGGKYTVRRPDANGKTVYTAPPKRERVLYALPAVTATIAAGGTVYVVEGEKDADALNTALDELDAPAAATTAPFGAGAGKWLPQYTAALAGAHVVLVPDLDGPDHEPPHAGERHTLDLADELDGTVASLRFAAAAAGKDPADHLAAGHTIAELVALDREELAARVGTHETASAAPAPAPAPAGDPLEQPGGKLLPFPGGNSEPETPPAESEPTRAGGGGGGGTPPLQVARVRRDRFAVIDGSLCEIKTSREGEQYATELLPAGARITRKLKKDIGDGDPVRVTHRDLEVTRDGETHTLTALDEDEWPRCGWVEELPFAAPFDDTNNGRSKLRKAIVAVSGDVPVETLYGRLGWWEINGEWVYLHARGAISSAGATGRYRVQVDSAYQPFWLPDPAADTGELRAAALAALAPLATVPHRLAAPMLGAAFRACLGWCRVTVLPVGSPTSGKSGLAAIGQQFYAPNARYDHLPFGMGESQATTATLEEHRYIVGDMLTILDDGAPDHGTERLGKRQNELVRSQAECRGKGRRGFKNKQMITRPEHKPRGLLGLTAEQWVGIESTLSRTIPMPMYEGELDPRVVFGNLDRDGRPLRAAELTASMVQHYADQMPMTDKLREQVRHYQPYFLDASLTDDSDRSWDARRSESFAELFAGCVFMLRMVVELGALTEDEAEGFRRVLWRGLIEAKQKAGTSQESRPATRAADLLRAELIGKRVALLDRSTGQAPADAALLGWDEHPGYATQTDPSPEPILRRAGTPIGWRDGNTLHLVPESTNDVIAKAARGAGLTWAHTHESLAQLLGEAGIITPKQTSGGRRFASSVRMGPERPGKQIRVWSVPMSWLFPDDSNEDGGPGEDGPDDVPPPPDARTLIPLDSAGTEADAPATDPVVPALTDESGTNQDEATGETANETVVSAPVAERFVDLADALPCLGCGEPATRFEHGSPLHVMCTVPEPDAQQPTDEPSDETGDERDLPGALAPADPTTESEFAEGQDAEPVTGWRMSRAQRRAAAFDAPGVVADVRGGWLLRSDGGDPLALPAAGDDTDGLVALLTWAYENVRLGKWAKWVKARSAYGQVWITPAMRRALELPASLGDLDGDGETRQQRLVRERLEAGGFSVAGQSGSGVNAWTTIYRTGAGRMRLVVPDWLDQQRGGAAWDEDDPATDPATLARRLGRYAELHERPFEYSPAVSGTNMVGASHSELYDQDRPAPPPPGRAPNRERDYTWHRAPEPDEASKQYVHAWDFNAMHLGVLSSLVVGRGAARNCPDATFDLERDRNRPGYWRIPNLELDHARLPDPLQVRYRGGRGDTERRDVLWVTTPTMRMLAELYGLEDIPVTDAYLWDEDDSGALFEKFYRVMSAARHELLAAGKDSDAAAVLGVHKATYRHMGGRMIASRMRETGNKLWRPDWRHHQLAQSRYAITRRLVKVGERFGLYPLTIATDAVVYASNEPDPHKAIPTILDANGKPSGGLIEGTGLGQVKHIGTLPMSEAAPLLRGSSFPSTRHTSDGTVRQLGLMDRFKQAHNGGEQQ